MNLESRATHALETPLTRRGFNRLATAGVVSAVMGNFTRENAAAQETAATASALEVRTAEWPEMQWDEFVTKHPNWDEERREHDGIISYHLFGPITPNGFLPRVKLYTRDCGNKSLEELKDQAIEELQAENMVGLAASDHPFLGVVGKEFSGLYMKYGSTELDATKRGIVGKHNDKEVRIEMYFSRADSDTMVDIWYDIVNTTRPFSASDTTTTA